MQAELDKLPESLGKVEKAALDSGFFSEHNTQHFEAKGIEPYIASGRQNHYPSLEERLAAPPPPPQDPDALAAMNHRLKTDEGRQFYAIAPIYSGAGIRHYQRGHGLPPFYAAGFPGGDR